MIVLRSEAEGVCPDTDHSEIARRGASQSPAEMGPVLRRQTYDVEVRKYELRWEEATEPERWQLLQVFYASQATLSLLYTPIGETDANAVTCYFVPGTLSITQNGPNAFQMAVDIEEVI